MRFSRNAQGVKMLDKVKFDLAVISSTHQFYVTHLDGISVDGKNKVLFN